MRKEAEKRIGHLYPKVKITKEMVDERPDLAPYLGRELTVIAWIWARTVKSPNPAFSHVDVPLASTFMLSTKKGKEAYVQPVIEILYSTFILTVLFCSPKIYHLVTMDSKDRCLFRVRFLEYADGLSSAAVPTQAAGQM